MTDDDSIRQLHDISTAWHFLWRPWSSCCWTWSTWLQSLSRQNLSAVGFNLSHGLRARLGRRDARIPPKPFFFLQSCGKWWIVVPFFGGRAHFIPFQAISRRDFASSRSWALAMLASWKCKVFMGKYVPLYVVTVHFFWAQRCANKSHNLRSSWHALIVSPCLWPSQGSSTNLSNTDKIR